MSSPCPESWRFHVLCATPSHIGCPNRGADAVSLPCHLQLVLTKGVLEFLFGEVQNVRSDILIFYVWYRLDFSQHSSNICPVMTPACPMTSSSQVLSYKLFVPSSSSFNAPIKQVRLFSDTYIGKLECHRNISLHPNQLLVLVWISHWMAALWPDSKR